MGHWGLQVTCCLFQRVFVPRVSAERDVFNDLIYLALNRSECEW